MHRQCLSDIINDKREATVDMLVKVCEVYKVNPTFLLLDTEEPFLSSELIVKNTNNISFMSLQAQAEYIRRVGDLSFFFDLPKFSIPDPRLTQGNFVCFETEGDHMEPSFQSGDKVVCVKVDRKFLSQILRNNQVYVIITSDTIYLNRISNELESQGQLALYSDNEYYEPIYVKEEDIEEVWRVEMKLSKHIPKKSNLTNLQNQDVFVIKEAINSTQIQISQISKSLEKILSQQ